MAMVGISANFAVIIGKPSMRLKPSPYFNWPRGIRLSAYDKDMVLIDQSRDHKYDLNDNLFQAWSERTVYLEVEVHNKHWRRWNREALSCIETTIRLDLEFDGNEFSLRRHTRKRLQAISDEPAIFVELDKVFRQVSG